LWDDWRVTTKAGIDGSVLERLRVGGQERAAVEYVLHEGFLSPVRDDGHVDATSPRGSEVGVHGSVIGVSAHLSESWVGGNQRLHHGTDGSGAIESVRGVDDTEHALGTMVWEGTVKEDWVGVIDNLLENEILQLNTRGKWRIGSLVAGGELRALGDSVVVSAPDKLDGIADGSVDGKGDVSEDTLGRSNPDDVSLPGLGG
jgi:hypothetical protein